MTRRLLMGLAMALGLSALSCGDDDVSYKPQPCSFAQQTEDEVLNLFLVAYRNRSIDCYMELLAADFRFYLDPRTRSVLDIEYWTRSEDSLATARLFHSTEVKKVVVDLRWPNHTASSAGFLAPREGWTRLFLNDVFLDVDVKPVGQEATTYRVEDQQQQFYFRRGRTNPPAGPGDTLVYIVEWHDEGAPDRKGTGPNAVQPATWSGIKVGLVE